MSDNSAIEWTDATWNPVTGCSVVSRGCTNCYAMRLAGGRGRHWPSRAGLTFDSKAGPVWNGKVRLNPQWLEQPLAWRRPRRIFVCAHGDLFHEAVPDEWIDRVFAVMALSPRHIFQVLTKRPRRMRAYVEAGREDLINAEAGMLMHWDDMPELEPGPLPNVWLGVSAEDQARANERVPELLRTPAAVRFLSAEPLLGPIDLTCIEFVDELQRQECWDALDLHAKFADDPATVEGAVLNWVIAGGESGPGARPMHPDWPRALRDQCAAAGVPFFFKQWGEWADGSGPHGEAEVVLHDGRRGAFDDAALAALDRQKPVPPENPTLMHRAGKKRAGRRLDGRLHDAMPARGDAENAESSAPCLSSARARRATEIAS